MVCNTCKGEILRSIVCNGRCAGLKVTDLAAIDAVRDVRPVQFGQSFKTGHIICPRSGPVGVLATDPNDRASKPEFRALRRLIAVDQVLV